MDDYNYASTPSVYPASPVKRENRIQPETPQSPATGPTAPSNSRNEHDKSIQIEFFGNNSYFLQNEVTPSLYIVAPNTPENVNYSEEEDDNDYSGDEVDHGSSQGKVYTEMQQCPSVGIPLQHDRNDAEHLAEKQTEEHSNISSVAPNSVIDDYENEDGQETVLPNCDTGHGWSSPLSSQGSTSSAEYLYKITEGLANNVTKVQSILQNPVPNNILYKLIQNYFSDKCSIRRFISNFTKDVIATACYTGMCLPNSEEAENLEMQLESLDQNMILGIMARVMLEKSSTQQVVQSQQIAQIGHLYSDVNSSNKSVQVQGSTNHGVFKSVHAEGKTGTTESGREMSKQQFGEKDSADSRPVTLATNISGTDTLPEVPNYLLSANTPEDPVASSSKGTKGRRKPSASPRMMSLNMESTWENANEAFEENVPYIDKQIEKVCQILFDDLMTTDEIKTCTASGKTRKNKKKSQPFDKLKVRLIKEGCAFIFSKPTTLTTKAFLKAKRNRSILLLTPNQVKLFEKKVLHEYAYRRRKKIEKDERGK